MSVPAASAQTPPRAAARSGPGPLISAGLLVLSLFAATAAGWFGLPRDSAADPAIVLGLWVNIAILLTAMGVEASRRPYSLHLMHLVALFLFLGASALFQYSIGYLGVAGPVERLHREVTIALIAVSLWVIAYVVSYEFQRQLRGRPGPVIRFFCRPVVPQRGMLVMILALMSLAYLAAVGLAGAATRANALETMSEYTLAGGAGNYSVPFYLIHGLLLRGFSLVALLGGLVLLVRDPRAANPLFILLVIALALGTLVANNPFAASRMWFATTLIGFSAPFALARLRTGWGLVLVALGGIVFLPALHESRFALSFDEFLDYAQLTSPLQYLSGNSDVDSLGMLTLCQRWTETHDHRWGMQTLGAFLSWFPRTLWPSKPVETGGMVTGDLGFEFTNLAPPVMADALVDFGLLGVPIVGALFGILLARLDRAYWEPNKPGHSVRAIDCVYPLWLGCIVFITRGGSFASFVFTMSFTTWALLFAVGVSGEARNRAVRLTSLSANPGR